MVLTNYIYQGLLTVQNDPDPATNNPGAVFTTGYVSANTYMTAGTYITAGQYVQAGTYVSGTYCNFTSTSNTNIFAGPLTLNATAPLTSSSTGQFTTLTTTSTTAASTFNGPVSILAALNAQTLTLTGTITTTFITANSASSNNTFAGPILANNGLVSSYTLDATSAGSGVSGAAFAGITNTGGFSNYLSAYIGGRLNVASVGTSVNSNYSTPSSTTGVYLLVNAPTWTDNTTAASGTAAANFNASLFAQPTLAASKTGVITPLASTLTIAGPPQASTNQTITNAWSLLVQSGNVQFSGTADANQSNTAVSALNLSGGLTVSKSLSCTNSFNTGYAAVINSSAGSSGAAITTKYTLTPNMVANSRTEIVIGQNMSTNNVGIINFNYVAAGSNSNSFGFGLFGSNNRLTINGAGQVAIATTSNATSASGSGSFTTAGGGSVAQDFWIGGTLYTNRQSITSTVDSTSTTTGALIANSAGFAANVYAGTLHTISQYYIAGTVNSSQNVTFNQNVALAVSLSVSSSSGTDMSSALVSGSGTNVVFTAPYKAIYNISLTLLVTPSYTGVIKAWCQISSSSIFNGPTPLIFRSG